MRALGIAALLFALGGRASAAPPTFEDVRRAHVPSDAVLLDRHGEVLHELRVDESVRRGPWVALADVSPAVVQAVIQAEDRRFFEHAGVDWGALGDAAFDTLFRGAPRGASTLSMQVAAMLDSSLRAQGRHRSVAQKFDQIRAARALETRWTKRQILEAYLNLSPFRGEMTGIAAAARGLFGKAPSGLEAREAALLAALLRGPNATWPVVARRACAVAGTAYCSAYESLARENLGASARPDARIALAPHLARELLSKAHRRVATTLDARVQARVLEILQRQMRVLEGRQVRDAAALVLDNETGEVLAYAGNQGTGSSAPFVDGVRALRQAGSVLKPFLYETVLEERLLTAASLLEDSPANLATPAGLYVPQNYDREFHGTVSVRTALSSSLNVPAVRALMLLGTDRFAGRLRALGFDGVSDDGDFHGYSLALGSAEVSLWQLAGAYRSLATGGLYTKPRVLGAETEPALRVMEPAATWIVADILSDRGARSLTFGLDNPLATRAWSAVKTGTSKDMRDNWCAGFTRRYTVAVWVGNFDGSPMRDVSGVSGAAPAWLEIVQSLQGGDLRTPPPPRPPEVVVQRVRFVPPAEPERDEVFLRGTETGEIVAKPPAAAVARILYPGEGAVLAIDPDIPGEVQRVVFRSSATDEPLAWSIDGERLPGSGAETPWVPVPGRHELLLVREDGSVAGRVHFEVRGGSASPADAHGGTVSGRDGR